MMSTINSPVSRSGQTLPQSPTRSVSPKSQTSDQTSTSEAKAPSKRPGFGRTQNTLSKDRTVEQQNKETVDKGIQSTTPQNVRGQNQNTEVIEHMQSQQGQESGKAQEKGVLDTVTDTVGSAYNTVSEKGEKTFHQGASALGKHVIQHHKESTAKYNALKTDPDYQETRETAHSVSGLDNHMKDALGTERPETAPPKKAVEKQDKSTLETVSDYAGKVSSAAGQGAKVAKKLETPPTILPETQQEQVSAAMAMINPLSEHLDISEGLTLLSGGATLISDVATLASMKEKFQAIKDKEDELNQLNLDPTSPDFGGIEAYNRKQKLESEIRQMKKEAVTELMTEMLNTTNDVVKMAETIVKIVDNEAMKTVLKEVAGPLAIVGGVKQTVESGLRLMAGLDRHERAANFQKFLDHPEELFSDQDYATYVQKSVNARAFELEFLINTMEGRPSYEPTKAEFMSQAKEMIGPQLFSMLELQASSGGSLKLEDIVAAELRNVRSKAEKSGDEATLKKLESAEKLSEKLGVLNRMKRDEKAPNVTELKAEYIEAAKEILSPTLVSMLEIQAQGSPSLKLEDLVANELIKAREKADKSGDAATLLKLDKANQVGLHMRSLQAKVAKAKQEHAAIQGHQGNIMEVAILSQYQHQANQLATTQDRILELSGQLSDLGDQMSELGQPTSANKKQLKQLNADRVKIEQELISLRQNLGKQANEVERTRQDVIKVLELNPDGKLNDAALNQKISELTAPMNDMLKMTSEITDFVKRHQDLRTQGIKLLQGATATAGGALATAVAFGAVSAAGPAGWAISGTILLTGAALTVNEVTRNESLKDLNQDIDNLYQESVQTLETLKSFASQKAELDSRIETLDSEVRELKQSEQGQPPSEELQAKQQELKNLKKLKGEVAAKYFENGIDDGQLQTLISQQENHVKQVELLKVRKSSDAAMEKVINMLAHETNGKPSHQATMAYMMLFNVMHQENPHNLDTQKLERNFLNKAKS